MKDDFYKDMNHKRAQDEKASKKTAGNKKTDQPKHETLSRSARHKAKDNAADKQPVKNKKSKQQEKSQPKENNFSNKLKGYFSADNAAKGKAFFAGKFNTYQSRIKNELKISKEKLGSLGAGTKAAKPSKQKEKNSRDRRMLPWVVGLLVLIPITALLAFLIFSNFWPSLNEEIQLAEENTSEETAENEQTAEGESEGFNEELEAQKAEHERRLAENRGSDLAAKDLETNYSQSELEELEEASVNAIRSKEEEPKADTAKDEASASDSEDESSESAESQSETETAESEANSNAAESETNSSADSNSESESGSQSPNANASHTVSAEDNLYRIAIQYYGDGSAENVQRIMQANGVTPDSLSVGQELIIP